MSQMAICEQNNFFVHFYQDVCSYKLISKQLIQFFFKSLRQLMKFEQSLIKIRSKTMSSEDRPVQYIGKVPSYTGEKENLRDTSNVFRKQAHTSYSDPMNDPFRFLKRCSNKLKKTHQSSDEIIIKEKIEKFEKELELINATFKELLQDSKQTSRMAFLANRRGDTNAADRLLPFMQYLSKQIQDIGKQKDRIREDIHKLKIQLQKLQDKKI